MNCEHVCLVRESIRLSIVCIAILEVSWVYMRAWIRERLIVLHAAVLAQKVSPSTAAGAPGMAHTPTSPANSPSAASTESMPEVARNPNFDVRILEGTERFKDMPLGEKYEGRYKFMNVDQADEEISFLTGKVEGLKVDIEEYDSDLEDTFTRYRDAKYECRSLSEDIGKLQEDLKVQGHLMETAKKEGTKLEEKIAECKGRMGELEVQLGYAQEARHELKTWKVVGGKSHKRPLGEGSPVIPREQGDVGGTNGRPSSSGSKMDNEMVQEVVDRMALLSESGGKEIDPLIIFPFDCTLAVEGIPYHTNEYMYLPALVSCFGRWKVPNRKVVAVDIPRVANHEASVGGKYVNRGYVLVRFSERWYMEEVRCMIEECDPTVVCDVKKGVQHKLRCRPADRDIGSSGYFKVSIPILERIRYFEEVFMCLSMDGK